MRTRSWLLLLFITASLSVLGTLAICFGHVVIDFYSNGHAADRRIDQAEQRRVAAHEMGHAVVAAYLHGPNEVEKVTVYASLPPDSLYGVCHTADHNRLDTADDIMREASVFMAGRAADKFVNGAPTNGATSDLSHVNDLIWTMHLSNGLGGSLLVRSRSEAPAAVTQQVEEDINATNACAEAIVRANSDTIVLLADRIMREEERQGRRVLSGDAFRAFLHDHPLKPLPPESTPVLMAGCHPSPR
ncbi:MAG TPA: hypothetical protein VL500_06510 [Candidatus Eisenbacteria bacterium]|nr:hypothetical protein [Candidatus Eisenbacteria bacterium]